MLLLVKHSSYIREVTGSHGGLDHSWYEVIDSVNKEERAYTP
jgi:hypothetical protein